MTPDRRKTLERVIEQVGPERARDLANAQRLIDLIERRKREGRVRILGKPA